MIANQPILPGAPAHGGRPLSRLQCAQELRCLPVVGTVLHLGAHPDDENSELITWLARGRGYRTAYLSVTRGEGGQNLIGPHLDEQLGVLRTQELLASRRIDGSRQFFTRAVDTGYSRSPDEALRRWDHDQVLADVVRVYRYFTPDVVITCFPPPPGSGGHGHHSASAILAVEAFARAGDRSAYPEQFAEGLAPWQPRRVLWNPRAGADITGFEGPVLQVDIAGTDAATGEPFAVMAARSRAMNKTQGAGRSFMPVTERANLQRFVLLAGDRPSTDLMDGVDTSWGRIAGGTEIDQVMRDVLERYEPNDPAASVPRLLEIRRLLRALRLKTGHDPAAATVGTDRSTPNPGAVRFLVDDMAYRLDRIIGSALGLRVRATTSSRNVVPGETFPVRLDAQVESDAVPVEWRGHATAWNRVTYPRSERLGPGRQITHRDEVHLPPTVALSHPYWLREEDAAGSSSVTDVLRFGRADNPPSVAADFSFDIGGERVHVFEVPVEAGAESSDSARVLEIVAPVSLTFGTEAILFAPGATRTIVLTVVAARAPLAGRIQLEAPDGWNVMPSSQAFQLASTVDSATPAFQVTAPAASTSGWLSATAEVAGRLYSNDLHELRYPHVPVQTLQPPARVRVADFDVRVDARRVGYVPGTGDSVPASLAQLGCDVVPLAGPDLTVQTLRDLDAVVIGVCAFNERDDLAASLEGLFAWVELGGTVVAQHNRPTRLKVSRLGPYPVSIQGPISQLRATDPTAPVTFLDPQHQALNSPNRMTAADFEGWIQERGAYFPSAWDETHYASILAISDPGGATLDSSLLIATHGRGHFVYTGLALFRQLPACVPGAYRLLANLISLGKAGPQ